MKLKEHGKNISACEITNIDAVGFWLFVDGTEHYLSYTLYPWFLDATIKEITTIVRESDSHFYWPLLDVDLTLDMIENPENYPLRSNTD